MNNEQGYIIRVIDDAGILGLLDADNYVGFLKRSLLFADIDDHLAHESSNGIGVFWGTGRANEWRIKIHRGFMETASFRQFTTVLHIEGGNLILAYLGELRAGIDDPLLFNLSDVFWL